MGFYQTRTKFTHHIHPRQKSRKKETGQGYPSMNAQKKMESEPKGEKKRGVENLGVG